MNTKTLIPLVSLALGVSALSSFSASWSLGGNAGTTPGIDFLGTTDNHPLVVQPQGTVTMGVIDPNEPTDVKLRVGGNARMGNGMSIGRSGTHYDEIGYNVAFSSTNDVYSYVGRDFASSIRLGYSGGGAGGMEFRTAPYSGTRGVPLTLNTRMVLTEAGSLGIGTTTPSGRLTVVGDSYFSNAGDGNVLMYLVTERHWQFRQRFSGADTALELASVGGGGNKNFIINTTGKVGIGTTLPQAQLDVNGQVRCTTLLLTSDRNAKTNFLSMNNHEVLKKVASLGLTTWEYTNAPGIRHLGPMAQDFKAAFSLGEDDKHIATVDADGVALASIQALYELVQNKDSEIAALKREVSTLKRDLAGIKGSVADRLAALEKAVSRTTVLEASFRPEAAR